MKESEKIEIFKKIEFGDIDANSDPNLEKYFIDNDYWNKIIASPIYYVIGKKGTGKSALYKMFKRFSADKGVLISNNDFGDFPFNKLMQLSDEAFSKPNQYQSIWQLVILNNFISLIVNNDAAERNEYFDELNEYYKLFIGSANDLHRLSISKVNKKEHSLQLGKNSIIPGISSTTENESTYGNSIENISDINRSLLNTITNYFKACDSTKYLIQFDRLDDTYNQLNDVETYYHVIISLMKVVYKINNLFRSNEIHDAKVIIYLRTDIIDQIGSRDAESARWEDFTYKLNWAIVNKNDWNNPMLLQMINKRISVSLSKDIKIEELLESSKINIHRNNKTDSDQTDIFKYIIEQTLHRPRDLIKFCKCIQDEIRESDCHIINYHIIKNAEKEYCFWLVNKELANEINPVIHNIDELYDFLRSLGSKPFSFNEFYLKFNKKEDSLKINMNYNQLIEYLYDIGILMNTNYHQGQLRFRSKIRNPGTVNRNMKLIIHSGVWKGINA